MQIEAVTIRTVQVEELAQVARMRAIGFDGDKARILASLSDNPRYDHSHILVAEHQNQLIGTATVFPAQMWLSGVPLPVGAVAGVTVLPEFQKKSVAAKLMEAVIARMHADGQALSLLFPFSHKYYRKFGYGTAGDLHAYRFRRDNVAVSGEVSKVRPLTPDDLPMLRVVYKGQLTWHNGWFTRSNAWWDKIVERWPHVIVFENDDMIEGYCVYQISRDKRGDRLFQIKEFFAGDPAAYQGLLGYLATQTEAEVIDYLAPPDTPLRHSLVQPVSDEAQNRGWIFNDLCHVAPGPMARIINLAKALTTRFYTRGMSGERLLQVIDPLIPENETPLVFRLVDGRAETRPATEEDNQPRIETDIATLSQILCGYLKAVDGRRLGRFKTDEDTASWIDKIIVDAPLYIQAGDWF